MPQIPIGLLQGDRVENTTDWIDALPVNCSGVVKEMFGSRGYMLQQPGLTVYGEISFQANLENHSIDTGDLFPDGAEAIYRLNTNGEAEFSIDEGDTFTPYEGEWLVTGQSSDFECRMDIVSGAFTSGTTGVWLPLSSTQSWGLAVGAGSGTLETVGTISIRQASTEVVLATATINLTAQSIQPIFDYVTFDGTNDYLSYLNALTGVPTNSKVGTFAARIRISGGNGTIRAVIYGEGSSFVCRFLLNGSNLIRIEIDPISSVTIQSLTAYTSADGWLNILASWDCLNNTEGQLYVNDINDYDAGASDLDDFVLVYNLMTIWGVGARGNTGGNKYTGDMGFVWWDFTTAIDFSIEANRRKFFTADGCPEDLGSTGEIPTGTAPILYFSGDTSSFPANKGTGGGFTLNGTLGGGTFTCP